MGERDESGAHELHAQESGSILASSIIGLRANLDTTVSRYYFDCGMHRAMKTITTIATHMTRCYGLILKAE